MQQLQQFWKWLWGIKISKKIVYFKWLALIHRVTPVGEWGKVENANLFCLIFVCIQSRLLNIVCGVVILQWNIWKKILRILRAIYLVNGQLYYQCCIRRRLWMFFFFQNEATFPLVRKDYYKESIQGDLYTNRGIFLRSSSRRLDYLHSLAG